jgi:hypothetical protein
LVKFCENQGIYERANPFLSGSYTILTTGMSDHPASGHSGTGLEKNNDAGASPVPE